MSASRWTVSVRGGLSRVTDVGGDGADSQSGLRTLMMRSNSIAQSSQLASPGSSLVLAALRTLLDPTGLLLTRLGRLKRSLTSDSESHTGRCRSRDTSVQHQLLVDI